MIDLYIPSPPQGEWSLFGFPIRAYALAIMTGIVVAWVVGSRRWAARGGRAETLETAVLVSIPLGIIGARVYYVLTDLHLYFGPGRDPISMFYIWEGGLAIFGAVAGGAFGMWLVARRRGASFLAIADALAPGLVLAQAIGRLGNYFNQELFGVPTTLPWPRAFWRIDGTGAEDQRGQRQQANQSAHNVGKSLMYVAVIIRNASARRRERLRSSCLKS